jgi:hypothetical protein
MITKYDKYSILGDEIASVNSVSLNNFSHAEAVRKFKVRIVRAKRPRNYVNVAKILEVATALKKFCRFLQRLGQGIVNLVVRRPFSSSSLESPSKSSSLRRTSSLHTLNTVYSPPLTEIKKIKIVKGW